jgi:hypothetical protein
MCKKGWVSVSSNRRRTARKSIPTERPMPTGEARRKMRGGKIVYSHKARAVFSCQLRRFWLVCPLIVLMANETLSSQMSNAQRCMCVMLTLAIHMINDDMIYICWRSIVVVLTDESEERAVFLGGHPSKYWPPSKVCAVWCMQYSVPLCQECVIAACLGYWLLLLHLVIPAYITGHGNFLECRTDTINVPLY